MIYLILFCTFITVLLFAISIINLFYREKIHIKTRLDRYTTSNEKNIERLEGTLNDRLVKPLLKKANKVVNRLTPNNYLEQIEAKLKEAGNPANINAAGLVLIQTSISVISIIVIVLAGAIYKAPLNKIVVVAVLIFAFIYFFPKLFIRQKIQQKHKEIEKDLPDALDLLTVSVEAGLSFDGALAKLVEKMKGSLVDEFEIVLKEMRVGVSKREAFKSLTDRVPVAGLITFINAVLQADQLGVSIGNVLRIQSGQMRQKRRQKAQEAAMKAPIKMLFPMIFFILPTIFIVLLGPVIIRAMIVFGN